MSSALTPNPKSNSAVNGSSKPRASANESHSESNTNNLNSSNPVSQLPLNSHNPIKIKQIPITIMSNSSLGIVQFPSESSKVQLQDPEVRTKIETEEIVYKNYIGHGSDSENEDEEEGRNRKKQLKYNKVHIQPKNEKYQKKHFRVKIPINKLGTYRHRQKTHFILHFNNEKGSLSMMDDVYEAEMALNKEENDMLSFDQRMKAQNTKTDARRRQEKVEILNDKKQKTTINKK